MASPSEDEGQRARSAGDLTSPLLFLFYGQDSGLVKERVRAFIKSRTSDMADPFEVIRLTSEEIALRPDRLVEEAQTLGLWRNTRCIWIDAVAKGSVVGLEILLEGGPLSALVVIEAGALRRDSQLRRLCEGAAKAKVVECPVDTPTEILALIDEMIAGEGISIASEARAALAALLTSDRLSSRSELEKLALSAKDGRVIDLRLIEETVANGASLSQEALLQIALSGNQEGLPAGWGRYCASPAPDPQSLIAYALRHVLLLHSGFRRSEGPQLPTEKLRLLARTLSRAVALARREPKLAPAIALSSLRFIARVGAER